jgi:hypothetical protein
MRILSLSVVILFAWGFLMQSASAHGDATSLQYKDGNYLLELEHGQEGNPRAGAFVPYTVSLLDEKALEPRKFKSVFVRFAGDNEKYTIVNAMLAPDQFNPTSARMGVNLPEPGLYAVTVRFYDESDEEMASATYELVADPPYDTRGFLSRVGEYLWLIALMGGLVLGLVAGRFLRRFGKYV